MPQRSETRKYTPRCRRNAQDIRLWSFRRIQAKGGGAGSERSLWQSTLYGARSVSLRSFYDINSHVDMMTAKWGTVSSRTNRHMGYGYHPVRTSRWKFVPYVQTVGMFLTICSDTPWDEPTDRSSEFCKYLTGAIFDEEPWTRLGTDAMCMLILSLL